MNIEYDEEDDEEIDDEDDEDDGVRKFVIFGSGLCSRKIKKQCALIYKKDKDLEIEKDLGIKTATLSSSAH